VSRVVKRWIWRDKRGRPHNCIELEDGSKYVFEHRNGKVVPRPLMEEIQE